MAGSLIQFCIVNPGPAYTSRTPQTNKPISGSDCCSQVSVRTAVVGSLLCGARAWGGDCGAFSFEIQRSEGDKLKKLAWMQYFF